MSNQLPMAINPPKEHVLHNLLNCFTFIDTEKQLVIAYPVFLHLGYTAESAQAILSTPMIRQYTNSKEFTPREDYFISILQIGELIVNAPKAKYIPAILDFIKNTLQPLFNQKHDDFKKERTIMPNDLLTQSNEPLTMSSLEIAELCDKEHRNVLADIKNMLNQLDMSTAEFSAVYKANNGQTYECFNLNKELSLTLVAGYNVKLRHKIIQRWQELENGATPQVGYNGALKLLGVPEQIVSTIAQVYEERDELKRTKAQIGSKREATAMVTAANLSIENKKLKAQLNKSTDYATIRTVEKFVKGVVLKWRALKKYCEEKNLPVLDVNDPLYGSVKSYPAEAWDKVYGVKLTEILKGV